MKLAIPTEDGFTISQHFSPRSRFLISTIQLGEITGQEIRTISEGERDTIEEGRYENLKDCDKIMVREIDEKQMNELSGHQKEVIRTEEDIITTALIKYMNSYSQKESNTCCCP